MMAQDTFLRLLPWVALAIVAIAAATTAILRFFARSPGQPSPGPVLTLAAELRGELQRLHASVVQANTLAREEAMRATHAATQAQVATVSRLGVAQNERLEGLVASMQTTREAAEVQARAGRGEMVQTLLQLGQQLREAAQQQAEAMRLAFAEQRDVAAHNEHRQELLKTSVETRLDALRQDNAAKLEQMRQTVDEKLQGTLEQRLGASFNQVNQNLERVFKSVGEMQAVAAGVGDLKRVLSNVKSRGTWAEVSLGALLEQTMVPEQYGRNVEVVPHSGQRVEYAIHLPQDGSQPLWLPIDAKMPIEDYERLVAASERGDATAVEASTRALERAIRLAAKDICNKYVCPPHSTDFGVMFLPTEGLFAEVVRRPGLVDSLQQTHRVVVTGPTTLSALLMSLRMGFRTLAIQQSSGEVWHILGAVRTEFEKFGTTLDRVHKKLEEAQRAVHLAGVRRRAVHKRLAGVETRDAGAPEIVTDGPEQNEALR